MFVKEILPAARERLATVGDDAPLVEAARLLRGERRSLVVVCDGAGAMAGVITKTDVVDRISHCEGHSCRTAAATVMTREVTFCGPDDPLRDVWSVMKSSGRKHVPVLVEGGRPVGVLNARDVVDALLDEVQSEETLLREYVMCVGYR